MDEDQDARLPLTHGTPAVSIYDPKASSMLCHTCPRNDPLDATAKVGSHVIAYSTVQAGLQSYLLGQEDHKCELRSGRSIRQTRRRAAASRTRLWPWP